MQVPPGILLCSRMRFRLFLSLKTWKLGILNHRVGVVPLVRNKVLLHLDGVLGLVYGPTFWSLGLRDDSSGVKRSVNNLVDIRLLLFQLTLIIINILLSQGLLSQSRWVPRLLLRIVWIHTTVESLSRTHQAIRQVLPRVGHVLTRRLTEVLALRLRTVCSIFPFKHGRVIAILLLLLLLL